MEIQQIRNATLKITYGKMTFLVDPWLAERGAMGCLADYKMTIPDAAKEKIKMPTVGLPQSSEEILAGIDAYIITHIHPDHIDMCPDGTVGMLLNKSLPVYVQNAEDQAILLKSGFKFVTVLTEQVLELPNNVNLKKTPALHGTIKPCGPASGFILECTNEKSLYVAGDTIWFPGVGNTLAAYKPEVIVLNACAAKLEEYGRILMDDADVAKVYEACPDASIIASHMDTVAHAFLSRLTLKEKLSNRKIQDKILIPKDGETMQF